MDKQLTKAQNSTYRLSQVNLDVIVSAPRSACDELDKKESHQDACKCKEAKLQLITMNEFTALNNVFTQRVVFSSLMKIFDSWNVISWNNEVMPEEKSRRSNTK